MRQFLFIPLLFAAACLIAQSKAPAYSPPQTAQKSIYRGCYLQKLDGGTSAMRRGDYLAALRLFEEAKNCTEAVGNTRRIKELDDKIEQCNNLLGRNKSSLAEVSSISRKKTEVEVTGRKFNVSPAFARNTDENCFQLTVREADRAFRDSCWGDAAKLYRAAKSCADANQTDRERMNRRIDACTEAEEDELLQKEQKAIRTARHAIAAKFAADAAGLLREGNRSLAWRLADFANFFIAPDDNPQCLEVMYDTYFFKPDPGDKVSVRPPLCYQLAEGLGDDVQFKFSQTKSGERLYAFTPKEKKVYGWALPSMTRLSTESLEYFDFFNGFDVSPSGALLYYGHNGYILHNYSILVQNAGHYCFSAEGDVFFYEDLANGVIQSVIFSQSSRVQQTRKNSNVVQRNKAPLDDIPITAGLRDMEAYKDEVWVAYDDRVEVMARDKASGSITPRLTWQFADSLFAGQEPPKMYLFPKTRELLVVTEEYSYYYFLHLAPDGSNLVVLSPLNKITGQVKACTQAADTLIALTNGFKSGQAEEVVSVFSPINNLVTNRFYSNSGFLGSFALDISANGHWAVCQDGNGISKIWSLRDTGVSKPIAFENGYENMLSPDGYHLFSKTANHLKIFDADDMEAGERESIPTPPDAPFLPEGQSNQWAVYQSGERELTAEHSKSKWKQKYSLDGANGKRICFAFDHTEERYLAYSPGNGTVLVKSLADGTQLASANFAGEVNIIRSIPWTDKLLVVSSVSYLNSIRYTVKVWDFSKKQDNLAVVRLQGYAALFAKVSEQGDYIALSDGTDIRIFRLDNLNDESAVIQPPKNAFVNDFAFRPDGLSIAYGDSYGNVAIADLVTGKNILRFTNIWDGQTYPVEKLAFAYNGARLRLCSAGRLFTADLDANSLRELLQSGDRWLNSFTSEQINKYNLEIAFRYPGSFDRLAESRDLPLIGSFFLHFRNQSIKSNNIEQVRTYCDRAFALYELLDINGKEGLEVTMHEMYEDYILKLLLRNRTDEAAQAVRLLERRFDRPDAAIISAAHSSLLRHDLEAASRLYTDYLLRLSSDEAALGEKLEDLNAKLSQFEDYGLLDTAQVACLCEVFQGRDNFEKLCPSDNRYKPTPYSRQVTVYEQVFQGIDSINITYGIRGDGRAQALENTLLLAKTLEYPNPAIVVHPLEATVLALADTYADLAIFENNTPKTAQWLEKSIQLLNSTGPFKSQPDTARLSRLMLAHYRLGTYMTQFGKPAAAIQQFQAGLEAAGKLHNLLSTAPIGESMVIDQQLGILHLELCRARLLDGKPLEAQKAFEEAEMFADLKLLGILEGHLSLLAREEESAFINFGSIKTAQELGQALALIKYMAEQLPAQRSFLLAFEKRMKEAYLGLHPLVVKEEVDYWLADSQKDRFEVQMRWDSAVHWSNIALDNAAARKMKAILDADEWQGKWLNQQIFNLFYGLHANYADTSALYKMVVRSEKMLDFIAANYPEYGNTSYFHSNLAHMLWLRNKAGDRERAIASYLTFQAAPRIENPFELLLKDFKDFHRSGLRWPELRKLIERIRPASFEITEQDWREMEE